MKTVLELMMALTQAGTITEGAKVSAESGIAGAKEVYMAWGKEGGESAKALEEAWKAAQPAKTSSSPRGFADQYYDWLADQSRSEQEAHDLIMSNDSQNVRNHLTHYLNIWALAETVRRGEKVIRTITAGKATPKASKEPKQKASAEPRDEWEYNSADPYADVRSARETLKRELAKAKPAKTKVHPDKVAHLKDEELSKMYTQAFQAYSKAR